ncbi:hypothetical protein DXD51_02900 [Eubacterium sp. TM05-53]|jgi:thymidylate synthase|nr:hypothetical protein DXD51_02900 [Eubacterium sp. TM05-53]
MNQYHYSFDKYSSDGQKVYETLLQRSTDAYRSTYFTNACLNLLQAMFRKIESLENRNAYLQMELNKCKKELTEND